MAKLKERGAALRCTEQPIDMTTPAGKAFLDMLSVFAEFETALRRERQMEGIAKAQREGRYQGRPPTVDNGAIQTMHRQGKRVVEIMSALGVSRSSVGAGAPQSSTGFAGVSAFNHPASNVARCQLRPHLQGPLPRPL